MRRIHLKLKLLLVLVIPFQGFSQSGRDPERVVLTDNPLENHVDSAVHRGARTYMQDPNTVGLSIGICFKKERYSYNYGETRRGNKTLPKPDDFYCIGSIDKTFANLLLAQAVIDKKIKLEDDIQKYLPEQYPNLRYEGHPVLVKHLANHTSGLPRSIKTFPGQVQDSLRKLSLGDQVNFYSLYTQDSLLSDLHSITPDTMPGAHYSYNTIDTKVLMVLLEGVYQQPYPQLITEFVQEELAMGDTRTEIPPNEESRIPTGYFRNEPQDFANLHGYFVGPALFSTINDLLIYLDANLSEENPAVKLTHQLTWGKSNGFGMGLGWMMDTEADGARFIYHDGNTRLGYNSFFIVYPEEDMGIVILVNETIDLSKLGDLANNIREELKKS